MGVGKTSVTNLISKSLSFKSIDLDHEIQQVHGDITSIFNSSGESYFRKLEYNIFETMINTPAAVIATGGGIVTYQPSFDLLKSMSHVIWLKARFETIQSRIMNDKQTRRPLADKQLKDRYLSRQPLYELSASFTVNVDDLTVEEVAEKIINRYR